MLRWRYCGKLTSVVKWSWCLCVHKCGSLCRSMRRPCEMNQHDSTASDSRAFAEQLTTQHSVSWWSLFDSKFDHTPPWHPGSAGEFWCHQVQMYRQRWKQNKTKKETAGCPPHLANPHPASIESTLIKSNQTHWGVSFGVERQSRLCTWTRTNESKCVCMKQKMMSVFACVCACVHFHPSALLLCVCLPVCVGLGVLCRSFHPLFSTLWNTASPTDWAYETLSQLCWGRRQSSVTPSIHKTLRASPLWPWNHADVVPF